MFERFTDGARQVVVLAQEEARDLNHGYIGTEHILLGLLHARDRLAAHALEALDINPDRIRGQVVQLVGTGKKSPAGHIPFTPRAKKALELSLREAIQLGQDYIGTEHLLLGLIREGHGVAAQVLVRLGADLSRVREQVLHLMGSDPVESVATPAEPMTTSVGESRLDAIEARLTAIEKRLGPGPNSGPSNIPT